MSKLTIKPKKYTVASVNYRDTPIWFVVCIALYWLFIPLIMPILIITSRVLNREVNFISVPMNQPRLSQRLANRLRKLTERIKNALRKISK